MYAKRHVLLVLAAINFAIIAIINSAYEKRANQALFVQRLTTSVQNELQRLDNQLADLKRFFGNRPTIELGVLMSQNPPPLLIFEDEQLVFWSNHHFIMPYSLLDGNYSEKVVQQGKMIYLVKKTINKTPQHEYVMFGLIPLRTGYEVENNGYLKTELNPQLFTSQNTTISLQPSSLSKPIQNSVGQTLFYVVLDENFIYEGDKRLIVLFLSFSCLCLFGAYLYLEISWLHLMGRYVSALALLAGSLLGIRAFLLISDAPFNYFHFDLFDSRIYASTLFSPSIADLFLNMALFAFLLGYVSTHLGRLVNLRKLFRFSQQHGNFVPAILVGCTYLAAFLIVNIIESISYNSTEIKLDITSDLTFDAPKITTILVLLLCVVIYFIVCHIAARALTEMSGSLQGITFIFVLTSLFYYVISLIIETENILAFNVNVIYFALITYLNLPRHLIKINQSTFLYLFSATIATSIIGGGTIYDVSAELNESNKFSYTSSLVQERDSKVEFYFDNAMQKIANDPAIIHLFKNAVSPDSAKNLIRRHLTKTDFDRYGLQISIFDHKGQAVGFSGDFQAFRKAFANEQYQTDLANIYFIDDLATGTNQYLCFVPIEDDTLLGNIVLDFSVKRITPYSIYPTLFFDSQSEDLERLKDYSYGIFQNERLLYSYGSFIYNNQFLDQFELKKSQWRESLEKDGNVHLLVRYANDKSVVVTSKKYPLINIFSNFSFLFLMQVLLALIVIVIGHYLNKAKRKHISFSTRIQLYLNFAFFLPLLIVSVVTVSVLSTGNQSEITNLYAEKAQSVNINLSEAVTRYYNGVIPKQELAAKLSDIARLLQSDVHIYDAKGKLLLASQTNLFDKKLLAPWVNPRAYEGIMEKSLARLVQEEQLGSFVYNSAYVGLKSLDSGEPLGIVEIPFFNSRKKFEQQATQVISTIMQVFATMFILLLVFSYFSIKSLTNPLILVTQKLRKVSLGGKNETLNYDSDDEFGLLVGEYNKMLVKLEESKAALAQTEKESAWREMAKQVAHEIKNPLTPIKLTLQQMERVTPADQKWTRDSIRNILNEIDKLNEITTSFSDFARMPIPKDERFDIAALLRQVAALHDKNRCNIVQEITEGEFFVMADPGIMRGIFNNMIINGIQACAPEREPVIRVALTPFTPNRVMIEFSDNGTGIPEAIHDKVFTPNFTTKKSGSGIGLAYSKRGIQHSGGDIWFETKENEGTTFFIVLPLHLPN